MNIITLDEKQIQDMKIIGKGHEGTIYEYNKQALKLFNSEVNTDTKIAKIKLLHDSPVGNLATKPLAIVDTGLRKGYTMKQFESNLTLANLLRLEYKDKLIILKRIKNIIEDLHALEIIVGDIRYENILISENIIKFCDSDNFGINGINPELLNIYSKIYEHRYHKSDIHLDTFSFNVMSLLYLFTIPTDMIVDYVMNTDKIHEERIKELFKAILNDEKYTEEYFIDSLNGNPKKKRKLFI